jgi:rod shape-determining protein MreD
MTLQRFLLGAATMLTALLLQTAVITRLPLPGAAPDLLLVLVVAFALVEGPMSGMATGFIAGLLADLSADHELGRLALVYTIVGYLAGQVEVDRDRSALMPFGAVALGAGVGVLVFALEGALLGDPRVTIGITWRSLVSSVPYDVVLTPFVVPVVALLVRRIELDPLRR